MTTPIGETASATPTPTLSAAAPTVDLPARRALGAQRPARSRRSASAATCSAGPPTEANVVRGARRLRRCRLRLRRYRRRLFALGAGATSGRRVGNGCSVNWFAAERQARPRWCSRPRSASTWARAGSGLRAARIRRGGRGVAAPTAAPTGSICTSRTSDDPDDPAGRDAEAPTTTLIRARARCARSAPPTSTLPTACWRARANCTATAWAARLRDAATRVQPRSSVPASRAALQPLVRDARTSP